jgi:hypothetical protein
MTKVCAWCDRDFAPRSRTQACCSNRCRQYLNEWRKRQAPDYQPPVRGSDRRQRGTTAQRGLGTPHQRARGLLLTQLRAGSVMYCPFCHAQLRHGQQLDLDHSLPGVYGGTTGDRSCPAWPVTSWQRSPWPSTSAHRYLSMMRAQNSRSGGG